MIISALKQCCYICNCPDIAVDNEEFRSIKDGHEVMRQSTISCIHMNVCKYYNADEGKKE